MYSVNILPWIVLFISANYLTGNLLLNYFGIIDLSYDFLIFIIVTGALFYLGKRNIKIYANQSSLKYSKIYFCLVLIVFVSEIVYFGVPILNSVNYTEFGFPILHHVVANAWILVLTSKKADKKLLFFVLIIAICLANRTLLLAAIVAFLMRVEISRNDLVKLGFSIVLIFTMIGIIRSSSGAFQNIELVPGFVVPEYIFFIVLYLLGPSISINGNVANFVIGDYWNTTPEWYVSTVLPDYANFLLFYGFFLLVIWMLSRNRKLNYLVYPIVVHLPLTFFSNYLLTTTTVSAMLILLCLAFRMRSIET